MFADYDMKDFPTVYIKFNKNIDDSGFNDFLNTWTDLYKNKRGTITPQFGYSHRLYVYSFFVRTKFLSKTSVILFGFIKDELKQVGIKIKNMRPINIFTGRGVRFNKQIIYKKVGKVSSYR